MVCPKCGAVYEGKFCPNGCNLPNSIKNKSKQPLYKKWWVWVIVAVLVFSIAVNVEDEENTGNDTVSVLNSSSVDMADGANSLTSSESLMTYEEEIAQYKEVDFATLARNPDKYKGQKFKLTGEVIQVQEPTFGNTVELRINITKKVYEYSDDINWTDTIYATVSLPKDSDRILEEDVITFYGTCDGLYSYTSVMGSKISLPKINIKYWNIAEN